MAQATKLKTPVGYCQCGCGGRTGIAKVNNSYHGWVKGAPFRFIKGHGKRKKERYEVDKNTGCWNWLLSIGADGYAQTSYRGKTARSSRVYYETFERAIPQGMHILHKCDNKKCVNPEHLFLGSHKDNMVDMVNKGRVAYGERAGASKLKEEDVMRIRKLRKAGNTFQILANMFRISPTTAHRICNYRIWRNI